MNNAWHGLMEICIAGEGVGQRDILSQCSFSLFRTVGSDPVTNSLLSTEILWWAAHWKRPEKLLQKPNSGRHAVHLLLSSQCNSPGEKHLMSCQPLASGSRMLFLFEWHFKVAVVQRNVDSLDHPKCNTDLASAISPITAQQGCSIELQPQQTAQLVEIPPHWCGFHWLK